VRVALYEVIAIVARRVTAAGSRAEKVISSIGEPPGRSPG
jgi:hypothetical protein